MPNTKGIIETMKSGRMSFHVILSWANFSALPFLKNKEHNFPLPNAHLFP
jgi:hypothetical protein